MIVQSNWTHGCSWHVTNSGLYTLSMLISRTLGLLLIEKACEEVLKTDHLPNILIAALNLGNTLNTAGGGQAVNAFSITSLPKLNQMKTNDGKTTFLHVLIRIAIDKSLFDLNFKDDLPTVSQAGKIHLDVCNTELEKMEKDLEDVRNMSMSPEDEEHLLQSTDTAQFALSATEEVSQLRALLNKVKGMYPDVLKHYGEQNKEMTQPHQLFEIIDRFCKEFDKAPTEVEESSVK